MECMEQLELSCFFCVVKYYKRDGEVMMDSNLLSQRVSEKIVRELRNKNFGASPVNKSENGWDIEKICVT